MKLRRAYKSAKLKTHTEKVKLFGGGEDLCASCDGYFTGGGALESAPQFGQSYTVKLTEDVVSAEYFPETGEGFAVTTDRRVFVWWENDKFFSELETLGEYPASFFSCYSEGKPCAAIAAGNMIICRFRGQTLITRIPVAIKGACMLMGRVFAADADEGYTVRWSGADDMYDWEQSAEGAGYIKLAPERGKIYALFPVGERIVAFREYGLDFLRINGDPRHFSVVHRGSGEVTEKLTEGACAPCGGKLYFCSDSNLYCLDGSEITRVKIPRYMRFTGCSAASAHDGRYISFKCRRASDGAARFFLYDTFTGACAFFAEGMQAVWKTDKGFYGYSDGKVFPPSEQNFSGVWASRRLDFDSATDKLLKKLCLTAEGDIKTEVQTQKGRVMFDGGTVEARTDGIWFSIGIRGYGKVYSLDGEWEVRG